MNASCTLKIENFSMYHLFDIIFLQERLFTIIVLLCFHCG